MENTQENRYVKRTQKDYSMSLKLQIVQEIETGNLSISLATKKYGIQCRKTVVEWLKKFGNFDWDNQMHQICQSQPNKK